MIFFRFQISLPEWTKKIFPGGDLQWIADRSFQLQTNTPEMARLKSGFLIREMLNRFNQKIKSQLDPDRNLWIYSAHDTTVANILNTLNLFEVNIYNFTFVFFFCHSSDPFRRFCFKNAIFGLSNQ